MLVAFLFILTKQNLLGIIFLLIRTGVYMRKQKEGETLEQAMEALEKHIVIVPEEERFDMEFIAPTGFFVINANGDAVYFRTRSRPKAQEMADRLYGVGFYTVRKELKAAIR